MGSDSDVYVIRRLTTNLLCCVCCKLDGLGFIDKVTDTAAEMLEHLQKHVDAGHKVPQEALRRLQEEIETA